MKVTDSQLAREAEKNWHALSVSESFKLLDSSARGLSDAEAKARRQKFGRNVLPAEHSLSSLMIFLNQLKSPLVYVLFFAGLISAVLGHWSDSLVIFLAVVINTVFGFIQENKANKALSQLKKIVKQEAKVIRRGRELILDAAELVPGDVIWLRSGDKVPADARIIEAENFSVVEAALTGESAPSVKSAKKLIKGESLADRENMVYFGTLVAAGRAVAVVCATGSATEIGRISLLIKETKEAKTPLQSKLAQFSRLITIAVLVICLAVFILGFWVGRDPVEMFVTVVALAVAAIPEGLLVAVTIILTVGMQFILKRRALVRKLVAAETLGSTSIICTDKTGTLTEGRMRVSKIITADKEYGLGRPTASANLEKVYDLILKTAVLCSNANIENPDAALEDWRLIGDHTEQALLVAALESGFNKDKLDREYRRLAEIPFDSQNKFMATLNEHQDKRHRHVFAKGAPERVLSFCDRVLLGQKKKPLTAKDREYLKQKYESLSQKGLRLLAVGYKTGRDFKSLEQELQQLVFLGFVALSDPLRPEAKETIKLCRQAGIRPVIITGDHPLTAKAIFQELGLKADGNIVEGKELDHWDDYELKQRVPEIDVYARVEPRHKLRVVAAWRARGEVVAMTGDGINDAPALKAADIGIALGDGSDVTKETADIILLDNNFQVIVAAVEQGRVIFDNIRKVILYLMVDSFSEIILIAGSLLLGLPLPLLAAQILWINLAADGLPNIAMTLEPGEDGIMAERPRPKSEPILNAEMKWLILVIGVITDIFILGLFAFLCNLGDDLVYLRTLIFAALGFDSIIYIFSVRTLRHSIFTHNPFRNKFLLVAVSVSFAILAAAIYLPGLSDLFQTVPLGYAEWELIAALAALKVLLIETVKHHFIVKSQAGLPVHNKLKLKKIYV